MRKMSDVRQVGDVRPLTVFSPPASGGASWSMKPSFHGNTLRPPPQKTAVTTLR